jgi:hypothetical protein
LEEAVRHARSDNFHLVAASSRASSLERIARVVFGIVVVPFFAGLSLILVQERSRMGEARPKNAPPDVLLVAVILFFALIAAYGLDQLLAGVRPSRRRWFTNAEEKLGQTLDQTRGHGSVTVARVWGAPVCVHWSVVVGLTLVAGLQPGAWVGFLVVIVAHELGHAVLVRRFGQKVVGLSFHALGGECYWAGQPTAKRRALIAWGGVALALADPRRDEPRRARLSLELLREGDQRGVPRLSDRPIVPSLAAAGRAACARADRAVERQACRLAAASGPRSRSGDRSVVGLAPGMASAQSLAIRSANFLRIRANAR